MEPTTTLGCFAAAQTKQGTPSNTNTHGHTQFNLFPLSLLLAHTHTHTHTRIITNIRTHSPIHLLTLFISQLLFLYILLSLFLIMSIYEEYNKRILTVIYVNHAVLFPWPMLLHDRYLALSWSAIDYIPSNYIIYIAASIATILNTK